MKPERIFELVVWLLIVAGGLMAAYVSFGILSSEASGQLQKYSLSGAIVGALVSWGVLTSVYLQVRGSSGELEELRNRIEELQHKLIRGAPKPEGFTIEVDERQRIVLARPEEWQPKGGTIFDLELPLEKMKAGDTFAPMFRCFFFPIDPKSTPSQEAWVDKELQELKDAKEFVHSFTTEMVRVGAEAAGVKESLKVILRQFVRVEAKRSPETGKTERGWNLISKDEFAGRLYAADPQTVSVDKPTQITLEGFALRQGGACYVGDKKFAAQVRQDGITAVVTLVKEDINFQNQIEIEWENPEAGGLRSNGLVLIVSGEKEAEERDVSDVTPKSSEECLSPKPDSEEPLPPKPNDAVGNMPIAQKSDADEPQVVFQHVVRMRVVCYNEPLKRVYFFDFWDDAQDFNQSSAVFNQILSSVRFLD